MKKLFTLLAGTFFMLASNSNAQLALEHTYPSTGYFNATVPSSSYGAKRLYLVKLEQAGEKYVSVDCAAQTITFYNLNHSLYVTMSYSNVTLLGGFPNTNYERVNADLLYISQNLFNKDNMIEVLYTNYRYNAGSGGTGTWTAVTHIVKEDGTIMFTATDEAPLVKPNYHNQFYPIYNTAQGTKLILSKTNGDAKVYSLGGTFSNATANNNIYGNDVDMMLAPNPVESGESVKLTYQLPAEISAAELKVFDESGKEIKSYKIGSDMNEIIVEPGELPAGIYYYSVISGSKTLGTKKSLVIN